MSRNGIVIGVVHDLDDPQSLGRVRVSYPHLNDQLSDWARLVTIMAGAGRGAFFRPEIGDEVLMGFEFGDPRRPYVLGAVWSTPDAPPADDGDAVANNWRFFRSRSGHLFKFDDTSGAETIEIEDKDGSRRVVIDSANANIRVEVDDGNIEVTSAGDITVNASGTVSVTADTVEVDATTIRASASGDMNLEAGGTLTIQGSTVNIN